MDASGPWFIVVGHDSPTFPTADLVDNHDLNEAHWSYIERAPALLARGPMLTAEGHHGGSVHVVRAPDLPAAQRFAVNEPYNLAGLFDRLEVAPFVSWLTESMWERPRHDHDHSWLVLVHVDAGHGVPVPAAIGPVTDRVLCGGWMLAADGSVLAGAAVFLDGTAADADGVAADVADRIAAESTISVCAWRRGGRPDPQ